MTTWTPSVWSASIASRDSGRISSASFRPPMTALSDLLEQARAADADLRPVDRGGHAHGGRRGEAGRSRNGQAPLVGGLHDGLGQRVLAIGFGSGREREHRVRLPSSDRLDRGHPGLALRQGAGLVEQHRVDRAHALESEPILHEHTAACGAFRRDGHDERDRQTQCVRAGDDEDGDRADDGLVGAAHDRPHDGRDDGRGEREPEQQRGRAIGDPLRTRRGVLRLGDEPLDPREGRLVARGGDIDAQAGVGRDSTGGDLVADPACDGVGLARHHRLVHIGAAVDDPAVGGNAAARADHDDVADPQLGGRDRHDPIPLDALRLVRDQRGEGVECGARLRERAHLDPVAEQHDHDQQRQLPPELELVVQQPHGRSPGGEERDRDGEADQQHHAGLAGAQLADRAGQERPPAPRVHDGSETGSDPGGPAGHLVAEDHREHRRERDHRHRDDQIDPEQPPELADVVAVAGVAGVSAVGSGIRVAGVARAPVVIAVSGMSLRIHMRAMVRVRSVLVAGSVVTVVMRVRVVHRYLSLTLSVSTESIDQRAMLVKPRRRRLLPTTNTLDKAMAAPASIGLSRPRAATGIAAVL
jgi:hypothetical protein